MNDNLVSLFVLLVFILLLVASKLILKNQNKKGYFLIGIAGLFMGCGVGLKFSTMVYALCSGLFLPILFISGKKKLFTVLVYGFTGILGFFLSNGYWMWRLFIKFGNPLFSPLQQNIVKSQATAPISFVDPRFLPKSLIEYVTWPIISSMDSLRVSELPFSDYRFVVIYILIFNIFRIFDNP